VKGKVEQVRCKVGGEGEEKAAAEGVVVVVEGRMVRTVMVRWKGEDFSGRAFLWRRGNARACLAAAGPPALIVGGFRGMSQAHYIRRVD
jgi:hypothetical protein